MIVHPFVQFTLVVWVCAALGARATKDSQCIGAAVFITILAGIAYCIRN